MVAPLFSLLGIDPIKSLQNPSVRGPLALGTGSPTAPTVDTAGDDDGLSAPAPNTPAQGMPSQGGNPDPSQILAMLPSAQKARQNGTGGLGDALASGVDAAKGHSKFGAFAAGFAHGMKSADDYQTARAKGDMEGMNSQVNMLAKIFGMQKDQATQAETTRHNQATEANSAKSTSNLGEYYKSIAENKADKEPSSTDISLNLKRITDVSGFNPASQNFELLDPAVKEASRQRAIAAYQEVNKGKDPPPALFGKPYSSDNPTTSPETRSWWQRLTGSGQPTPAPAAPGAPPAAPGDPNDPGAVNSAIPGGQPAPPSPTPPPVPQRQGTLPPGTTPAMALEQARAAIAGGKDPAAVKARLQSLGIDDSGF